MCEPVDCRWGAPAFRTRRLKDYKNTQHWQHQADVRYERKIVKGDAGVVDGWRGIIEDVAVPQVWVPSTRRTEARSLILRDTTSEFRRCAAVPQ